MKRTISIIALTLALSVSVFAQDSKPSFKLYGFVRNYFTLDTRENVAGSEDFFTYLPKDRNLQADGTDANQVTTFRFAALTSRLGLDVSGYEVKGWKVGAKFEADFYAGLSGNTGTATFRLRQVYMTMAKNDLSLKIGQAWHPMAADMPDVFSLNAGAPFGPFNRSPEVVADYNLGGGFTLTGAAIWQMQYTSAGPDGASANYIKYGCTPEFYLGLSYKSDNFLARAGADLLSISPSKYVYNGKVRKNRITTFSPYLYVQYKSGDFSIKAKTTFGQAGEHMNLNGGYGVTSFGTDGSTNYTPTRNSSTWISTSYLATPSLQLILFGGYVRNFGTKDSLIGKDYLYFSKNSFSNMNRMWRVVPAVLYNMGKVSFGLEWEITSAQYGSWEATTMSKGLATKDLHWVTNNRLQAMVRYSF